MANEENPIIAIVLAIIGGILILLSGSALLALGIFFPRFVLGGFILFQLFASIIMALGVWVIICGIVVLFGSYMLYTRPIDSHVTWGIIIVIFSVLSFIGWAGFVVGALLGIIGGVWAIVWNPPPPTMTATVEQGPPE